MIPINGNLVSTGLMQEAGTYDAPAFVNQTEALQEKTYHHYMKGLLQWVDVPQTPEKLERELSLVGKRLVWLFSKARVSILPIDKRLLALERGWGTEYLQDPNDRANLVFDGKESQYLQALKDFYKNSYGQHESFLELIRTNAHTLTELAVAAREERVKAGLI